MKFKIGDLVGTSDDPSWKMPTTYIVTKISEHEDFLQLKEYDLNSNDKIWVTVANTWLHGEDR
jgi:hypothetical protein